MRWGWWRGWWRWQVEKRKPGTWGHARARTFLQLKTVAEMKDMCPLGDVAIESCATREQQEGLSRRGE